MIRHWHALLHIEIFSHWIMSLLIKLRFSSLTVVIRKTLTDVWRSCIGPLSFFASKHFNLFSFPIFSPWAYLMKFMLESYRVHWFRYILLFYYYLWPIPLLVDYYSFRGNHPPSIVSASALTWFIRYIYYWYFQSINNVIIKTEVLLRQTYGWPQLTFGYAI